MNPFEITKFDFLKNNSSFEDSYPLHYSIIHNLPNHIEFFLKEKIFNPNHRELFNYSALHFGVVCNANSQTLQKLLEYGCDPLQKTDGGYTARDIAMAINSNPEIIKLLEKYEKFQTSKTLIALSNSSNTDNQPRDPDMLRGASILRELKSNLSRQK
jgi:ankyrin repeat protein